MINEENLLINEDYTDGCSKEGFYKILKDNGIDMETVDVNEKLPDFLIKVIKNEPAEYNRFNNILYKLHKSNVINILDSIAYIEDDWLESAVLLKCLDELNYFSLRSELKKKHKITPEQSGLESLFA